MAGEKLAEADGIGAADVVAPGRYGGRAARRPSHPRTCRRQGRRPARRRHRRASTARRCEAAEARALLENVAAALDLDPRNLEKAEERLFALRALARKHNAEVDELPALRERLDARLAAVDRAATR